MKLPVFFYVGVQVLPGVGSLLLGNVGPTRTTRAIVAYEYDGVKIRTKRSRPNVIRRLNALREKLKKVGR